jgi:hypothetical protein
MSKFSFFPSSLWTSNLHPSNSWLTNNVCTLSFHVSRTSLRGYEYIYVWHPNFPLSFVIVFNLFNGSGDPKCCLRLGWVPHSSKSIEGFLVVCASQEFLYGVTQLVTFSCHGISCFMQYNLYIIWWFMKTKILNMKSCFASNSYITFFWSVTNDNSMLIFFHFMFSILNNFLEFDAANCLIY